MTNYLERAKTPDPKTCCHKCLEPCDRMCCEGGYCKTQGDCPCHTKPQVHGGCIGNAHSECDPKVCDDPQAGVDVHTSPAVQEIEEVKTVTVEFTNMDTGEKEPSQIYRPTDIANKLNEIIKALNKLSKE